MGDPLDANQYVQQAIIQLVRSSVNQKLAISGERGLVKGVAGRIFQQLQVAATGINKPVETLNKKKINNKKPPIKPPKSPPKRERLKSDSV